MYAKVFSSLWKGSLRGHSDPQHVFIYLLAHADEQGVVEAMPAAIADETGLALDQVRAAIAHLESPDPESRTPTHEGRRIQRLDEHRSWCWLITNYEHYRSLSDREKVRELTRERVRRFRARNVTRSNAAVTQETRGNAKQIQIQRQKTEAEEEAVPVVEVGSSSRIRSSEVCDRSAAQEDAADAAFEDFYANYPRKEKKPRAKKAFRRVAPTEYEALAAGLQRWKAYWAARGQPEFTPCPEAFLNGRQWEDEPPRAGARGSQGKTLMELGKRMKEEEAKNGAI